MNDGDPPPPLDDARVKHLVEAWRKTVDVQQHFNDIELRIRNYALTLLLAVTGAAGFTLQNSMSVSMFGASVSLAACLLLAGLGVHLAFYFMDKFWYHRLLKGAVEHGAKLEKELSVLISGNENGAFDLTGAIGRHSPVTLLGWKLHSDDKINVFYGLVAALLFLGILLVWSPRAPAPPKAPLSVQCVAAPSPAPSVTPAAAPSPAPSVTPAAAPSPAPSVTPAAAPSPAPSVTPTAAPNPALSVTPAAAPKPARSVKRTRTNAGPVPTSRP